MRGRGEAVAMRRYIDAWSYSRLTLARTTRPRRSGRLPARCGRPSAATDGAMALLSWTIVAESSHKPPIAPAAKREGPSSELGSLSSCHVDATTNDSSLPAPLKLVLLRKTVH